MNIVEIRSLVKDYALGNTTVSALRGVDMDIPQGSLMSVIGPSGSGKTTLLNIIGCVDTATSGSVKIDGRETTTLRDRELTDLRLRRIGFIFQTFNLVPVLSALENVEFPLLLQGGLSAAEVREKSRQLMGAVGLGDHERHKPAELSGGQRQRVAIARALVKRPALVIADEPTASLDSHTAEQVLDLMREQGHAHGAAFLIATHDARLLDRCDRAIALLDGQIQDTP